MGLFGGVDNSAAEMAKKQQEQQAKQEQINLRKAEEEQTRLLRARMTGGAIGGLNQLNTNNRQSTLG